MLASVEERCRLHMIEIALYVSVLCGCGHTLSSFEDAAQMDSGADTSDAGSASDGAPFPGSTWCIGCIPPQVPDGGFWCSPTEVCKSVGATNPVCVPQACCPADGGGPC